MPDFDKLQHHTNALNELLKNRELGIPTWSLMVGQHWKAISTMFSTSSMSTNIIERLSKLDPTYGSYQGETYCFFCGGQEDINGIIVHTVDCLWTEAKQRLLNP